MWIQDIIKLYDHNTYILSSPVCQTCQIDLYRKMTEQFRPELFDDSDIRPRNNQSDLVDVSITPYIYAILEFDEEKGLFSWYGTFMIEWMDDFIKWNTSANDDLLTLNLPANRVWIRYQKLS